MTTKPSTATETTTTATMTTATVATTTHTIIVLMPVLMKIMMHDRHGIQHRSTSTSVDIIDIGTGVCRIIITAIRTTIFVLGSIHQ